MKTFFRLVLFALMLLVVALVSALTTMQIAIHAREVTVPNLTGKTAAEARKICDQEGLPVEVERQYYSPTIAEGRIMSQVPAADSKVRRGWQVRVAESFGPQRIQIPGVLGESERAAEINIRRRGLDVSAVAHIPIPGSPADHVIAQSPPPNASDVSIPKLSLLVSDTPMPQAFVMPNLVGQFLVSATLSLQEAGLHAGKVSVGVSDGSPTTTAAPITPPPSAASLIVSQDPIPGQKILEGTAVNLTVR